MDLHRRLQSCLADRWDEGEAKYIEPEKEEKLKLENYLKSPKPSMTQEELEASSADPDATRQQTGQVVEDMRILWGGMKPKKPKSRSRAVETFSLDKPIVGEAEPVPVDPSLLWSGGEFGSPNRKKGKRKSQLPMPTSEVEASSPIPTSSKFVANGHRSLDYLPLFMSHAQLYVFADTYDILPLRDLAARRLDEALDQFKFQEPLATNFADLIQYVFDHTSEEHVLREVAMVFTANNIEAVTSQTSFGELMMNGGPIVLALVGKIVERL